MELFCIFTILNIKENSNGRKCQLGHGTACSKVYLIEVSVSKISRHGPFHFKVVI